MSDELVRELLRDAADGVEPGDRLDEVRTASRDAVRRRSQVRWAAGGVALVAASVVAAVALASGGLDRQRSEPADTSPTRATEADPATRRVVPVYFVGDTPDGPRLYREFQSRTGWEGRQVFALDAALRGAALDPDYRSSWPGDVSVEDFSAAPDLITVSLSGAVHDRPPDMDADEAGLAVEQLLRTAQAVHGRGRLPVRLLLDGRITDRVLGVPASEPLAAADDATVMSRVSVSDPAEGRVVDNDVTFTVTGRGSAYEGAILTSIQRLGGDAETVAEKPTTDRCCEGGLYWYVVTFDLSDVPPGDYLVTSRTEAPSGEPGHSDSRRITVID